MRILGRYAVVYLLNGKGIYQDKNGFQSNVRPGDLIFVFPNLPHLYGPLPGERWDEFYIVFDGPIFRIWQETGLIAVNRPIIHIESAEYWLRRLITAAGESTEGDSALALEGVVRMQQLLADIVTSPMDHEADRAWLRRAKRMIDDDALHVRSDLASVVKQLGTTYETFRKRFSRLADMSPNRYRSGRIMDRASKLLTNPNVTLRIVAETCGFCDEFHFSKRFKQLMGLSPKEFRKRLPQGQHVLSP